MKAAWASYPGAPAPGTVLGRVADLDDPGAACVTVAGFPVILTRRGGEVTAFVNACPHQYLPLNHRGEAILMAQGDGLICTNHDATFDARTGMGTGGYGTGCWLDPIPLEVTDGVIRIAGS